MGQLVIKIGFTSLSAWEKEQWVKLFQICFLKNEGQSRNIFAKYELNPETSCFCYILHNDEMVACYSGIILQIKDQNVFLSTDTMSNGVVRDATVKMAKLLYADLKLRNVIAVCGFPNKNIAAIRIRKLGWKIIGEINYYVGIPLLWRFLLCSRGVSSAQAWYLRRPGIGFFNAVNGFITLLGRNGLYKGAFFSLKLSCGTKPPGYFFIRVPSRIIQPKKFGFLMLSSCDKMNQLMYDSFDFLDMNSIDVP